MFNVGDKIIHKMWGVGIVAFGPFRVPEITTPCYLVENSEGHHLIGSETLLSAAPKFEVGDRVTFKFSPAGTSFELVAGPFPDGDESFYVLKDQEGGHETSFEKYMVPVVE
jgi:hypothetical protein